MTRHSGFSMNAPSDKGAYLRELLPYFWRNLLGSRIFISAGSLAFQTLLSMVPFLAVALAVLSAFPFFSSLNRSIVDFILLNFVPSSGNEFRHYVEEFVGKTSTVSLLGGILLVVIALSLISTIDHTLNGIWKVRTPRKPMQAFLLYWTVLTLGPLLMGSSLAASSYIWYTVFTEGPMRELKLRLISFLPFVNSLAAFFLLYILVPNRKVRLLHAFSGALLAAVLFELSKKWFVFYVSRFATFEHIYGALSAVPMLFFWVYLAWVVVLTGAELASCMGSVRQEAKISLAGTPLQALYPVLSMLAAVSSAQERGTLLRTADLRRRNGIGVISTSAAAALADCLLQEGVLQETAEGKLVIALDLYRMTLYELYSRLPLEQAETAFAAGSSDRGSPALASLDREVAACMKERMEVPVASFLNDTNIERL
ncbi:YihY family inner membrane protein [Chlorobium sp.]|uniref:YihY family inner membrane protein n=1 Tax=Chlorobium sp. TaxID=1095 RepID=UPI002F410730